METERREAGRDLGGPGMGMLVPGQFPALCLGYAQVERADLHSPSQHFQYKTSRVGQVLPVTHLSTPRLSACPTLIPRGSAAGGPWAHGLPRGICTPRKPLKTQTTWKWWLRYLHK